MRTTVEQTGRRSRTEEWGAHLRTNGYRFTRSRRAVVEILAHSHQVVSAAQLTELAAQRHPELGRATVYRALETLIELGLVHRVHDDQGCHNYIAADQVNMEDSPHALLICHACGRTDIVSSEKLEELAQAIEYESGYRIQRQYVQLTGLCTNC